MFVSANILRPRKQGAVSLTYPKHVVLRDGYKKIMNSSCPLNLMFISNLIYFKLSYGVASGSEITPCIKIDKPLVVYRFSGNVMK